MAFFDEWNEWYLHTEEDGNQRTSSKHMPIHHYKEVARQQSNGLLDKMHPFVSIFIFNYSVEILFLFNPQCKYEYL